MNSNQEHSTIPKGLTMENSIEKLQKNNALKSKTFVLDYSKWRCGVDGKRGNKRGRGATALLNKQGYMCCLGQFSLQLGQSKEAIRSLGEPYEVGPMKLLSKKNTISSWRTADNTKLSIEAMEVNDDINTSIEEKIAKLRKLFKTKGYKLRVINKPK